MRQSDSLLVPESVSWFVASNPGPLTLDGTRCYLVGDKRVVLVDPGPAIPGQLDRLEQLVNGRTVEAICLTHAHADHSGIAIEAAALFGARVAASADTLWRRGIAGRALAGGDTVPVGEGALRLRALEAPGHSADHLVYLLEPGRCVFTGDLVLGAGSSVVLHPDGEVGACLASFSRILSLRPSSLYPGHGPPVEDGEARVRHYRDHRIERHGQVIEAVQAGARTVENVRKLVYGDLAPDLERAADASIRAHIVYMREQGSDVSPIAGLDDSSPGPEES